MHLQIALFPKNILSVLFSNKNLAMVCSFLF